MVSPGSFGLAPAAVPDAYSPQPDMPYVDAGGRAFGFKVAITAIAAT
jgi:hypothetical protein